MLLRRKNSVKKRKYANKILNILVFMDSNFLLGFTSETFCRIFKVSEKITAFHKYFFFGGSFVPIYMFECMKVCVISLQFWFEIFLADFPPKKSQEGLLSCSCMGTFHTRFGRDFSRFSPGLGCV